MKKKLIDKIHNHLYWVKVNAKYLGIGKKCPICQRRQKIFAPVGPHHRANAKCIWCGGLERHRLIWLFFQRKTNLFDGNPKTMLHFAPERAFISKLKQTLGAGYINADLYNDAMIKIDICDIKYPTSTFDVICCVHVLEHVVNDTQAINELSRVLKNSGWALIAVPLNAEKTFEDENVVKPEERLKIYGQSDHVRICGVDYRERLERNGFYVTEFKAEDIVSPSEKEWFGIKDDTLYFCTKKLSIQ
jgi:SAM-dependent methyltransferase